MPKPIIADASCLILLDKINELSLLPGLYEHILITKEVAYEFGYPLPDWAKIQSPDPKSYQSLTNAPLDKGERSVIALSLEFRECLLILDDLRGRQLAEDFGIKFTGTLGLIVYAKEVGYLGQVKPIIEKIKQTNFRMTKRLEQMVLRGAGEN